MDRVTALRHSFPQKEWFDALRAAVAEDAEMKVIGRWCDLDLALAVGGEVILLRVRAGKLVDTIFAPDLGASWDVTLRGELEDWRSFLQPTPPPFYSDLLAMNSRVPSFGIEGDRRTFVRHLRPIGRIFALAQHLGADHA